MNENSNENLDNNNENYNECKIEDKFYTENLIISRILFNLNNFIFLI
jgi:hypothetical protein